MYTFTNKHVPVITSGSSSILLNTCYKVNLAYLSYCKVYSDFPIGFKKQSRHKRRQCPKHYSPKKNIKIKSWTSTTLEMFQGIRN